MKTLIKISTSVFLVFLVATACTDNFKEMNTNPNVPGIESAAPDMLLTNAIESMTDRVHEIFLGHEMGSCWAQHMAKAQYTDEDRYIPRVAVINNTWTSFYAASGQDIATIYEVGMLRGNDNYMGIALVLKAYITSVLTDLHGDIPYSEAWSATSEPSVLSPKYDTQESIYRDIIAKLDEANTLLDDHGAEISGDILFGNDIVMWKKFANSLRIRLLMRMSDQDEALATTEISKMIADPDTYPVIESNEENIALKYLGSAPNNNPINENRKTRDDHRVSANLIDLLYTDPGSPDYRVSLYANLASGPQDYVGMPNGLTSARAAAFNGNGLANTSKIGDFYSSATAPGMLMSYAELQFLLAEAAHRGIIPGGDTDAEAFYNEGIRASYYQNEDAMISVLEENWYDTFVSWGWDENDILAYALQDFIDYGGWTYDSDIAIEQIATQKYVAMFDQGLQSWFEWRRLDYPVLTPAEDGVNDGKIPVRVFYPSDEAARNPSNLNEAISRQGSSASDLNTRVWWDVK